MTFEEHIGQRILYKYRDCSDRSFDILRDKKIYFSSPLNFNDPFDCNFPIRFDILSDDELLAIIKEHVRVEHATAGSNLQKGIVNRMFADASNKQKMHSIQDEWLTNLLQRIGVYCVCGNRNNILLWSHYAKDHTGFSIGFNANALYVVHVANSGFLAGRVIYSEEYPIIRPIVTNDDEEKEAAIHKMLYTKAKNWEYENEVRLATFDNDRRCSFPIEAIEEIVIGAKMNEEKQKELIDIVNEHYSHVSIYKAKLSRYAFELEFDKIK